MSLLFKQKHLRVESPLTTDGMNLRYDENGKNPKKITVLPMSAKLKLESNQAKKPPHLRATITVVEGDKIAEKIKKQKEDKIK
jgi:hypothetical protein